MFEYPVFFFAILDLKYDDDDDDDDEEGISRKRVADGAVLRGLYS
jgi:hypothetical protein